jgi:xanthine dehydrogenase molybdopterin-binding subunit B
MPLLEGLDGVEKSPSKTTTSASHRSTEHHVRQADEYFDDMMEVLNLLSFRSLTTSPD